MKESSRLRIEEHKKKLTPEAKRRILLAGGSVTTKHPIDAQAICREVRGKGDSYIDEDED